MLTQIVVFLFEVCVSGNHSFVIHSSTLPNNYSWITIMILYSNLIGWWVKINKQQNYNPETQARSNCLYTGRVTSKQQQKRYWAEMMNRYFHLHFIKEVKRLKSMVMDKEIAVMRKITMKIVSFSEEAIQIVRTLNGSRFQ